MRAVRNVACVIGVCLVAALRAEVPTYSIEFMGSATAAGKVNEYGVSCGSRIVGGQYEAWVWSREQGLQPLPRLAGFASNRALDINDLGEVVGDCAISPYNQGQPCVWRPSENGYTVEALPLAPGTTVGVATAINNRGDIVGASTTVFFPPQGGPVWFNGPDGLVKLWEQGFIDAITDINESRQIVGGQHRMNLDTGEIEDLGKPEGSFLWTVISGINENGQCAARAIQSTSQGYALAARYSDDEGWRLLNAWPTSLTGTTGINDLGDVFVIATNGLAHMPAVYYDGVGLQFVDTLLDPSDQYWYLQLSGGDINNNQQVTVVASNDATEAYGPSLLTPLGRPIIPGDVDLDAHVTRDDLCAWENAPIDLNGDGIVDDSDEQWLLDRMAQFGFFFDDCTANGRADYCDVQAGIETDCDADLIADSCEPDCNADGVPDDCEPDCNDNGVPDACDLAAYTSRDCNENGVPDECDGPKTLDLQDVLSPALVIPLGGTVSHTLRVSDSGTVSDLNVSLDLDFRVADLTVSLEHDGVEVVLIDRPGYPRYSLGFTELGYTITLDDEGSGGLIENKGHSCCFWDPILSPPSYVPNESLSAFDGAAIAGDWTLTITTVNNASPVAQWFSWGLTVDDAGAPVGICDCNGNGVADEDDIAAGSSQDANSNGVPDECEGPAKSGDVDGDGDVDLSDLGALLSAYGTCVGDGGYLAAADFDAGGCIDLSDLGVLLAAYGS